ncbi:anthranilate synthase component I family protein [Nemorincola caseinilytica]|uniref:Anthranilate synthase component I family protein n=1 Tax=Nemorincola caseinilytica TaxID=2054315 RepID=A0ABP8N8L5_9BACT
MHRNKASYQITPATAGILKTRILNWAAPYSILAFLDNNGYPSPYSGYECLVAAGAHRIVACDTPDPLLALQEAHAQQPDWLFGHICYDLKNILEPKLSSAHPAIHGFPLLQFFVPETVCYIDSGQTTLTIETTADPDNIYKEIQAASDTIDTSGIPQLSFTDPMSRDMYIDTIETLRRHIADGDCYEINYCTTGTAHHMGLDTLAVFHALNTISPAPFAAYYRLHNRYMMCASPERYLRKEGNTVLSQPIKGTARRDNDPLKDEEIKAALAADIKERAENVMITDLVRNDLAHCCRTGSIAVDELFGIYTFPQVHQMISTISGTLRSDATFARAIRTSFPMGSMTGAPKHKVMQLIDRYETTRRELFSGTIGYITPGGDMDLNVIIRSLFYNSATGILSRSTGGAITYDSKPQSEWEEMRLKAWALERIFM